MFRSTKTYGHERGISACFRQWRAKHSHCSLLHGYALSFTLVFEAQSLDERHWVMDFGGLKDVETWLRDTFDHKLVIAADDPQLPALRELEQAGLAELTVLERGVGCERFAEYVGRWVSGWLAAHQPRVRVVEVECREHGANSAVWMNP